MRISNRYFGGELPKTGERNLSDNQAKVARDCEITSGELRAAKASVFHRISPVADARSLYIRGDDVHVWAEDVDVVETPIDTAIPRVFWTGEGDYPLQANVDDLLKGKKFRMGVPSPVEAPSVNTLSSGEDGVDVDTFYVTTFVNQWGEEGPPSPPSNTFTHKVGASFGVNLSRYGTPDLDLHAITSIRIYRSTGGTRPQFVTEAPILPEGDNGTYVDDTDNPASGTITSEFNYPPPKNAIGLHIMSNGVALSFVKGSKRVEVSEPYFPNTASYSFTVSSEIVAISSFDNVAVVGTKGYPEIATIVDPRSIVPVRLTDREPCVAKRGMVQGMGGVMYPSPEGLFFIGQGARRLLTQDLLGADDWDRLVPSSFNAVFRDGQYIAFHEGGESGAWVLDTREANATVRRLSQRASAAAVIEGTNDVYVVEGSSILRLDAGKRVQYKWVSKEEGFATPTAIGARRILSRSLRDNPSVDELAVIREAEAQAQSAREDSISGLGPLGSGGAMSQGLFAGNTLAGANRLAPLVQEFEVNSVTLKVFGDNELLHEETITEEGDDRTEYADRYRRWRYELVGNATVEQIDLATGLSDLHEGS